MRLRILLLTFLMLAVSVSGVYATWHYSNTFSESRAQQMGLSLSVFDYPPEEVLPDDEVATELGQNHLDLIEKILNEASYGLNATKKPIMHNLLNMLGDVVYCEQNVQGGNLKHLMIDGTGAYALLFQIEYVSETEYITYTYRSYDAKNYPMGTEIEVYKTVMKKGTNNKWTATTSFKGVAPIARPTEYSSLHGIDSAKWRYVNN